MVLPYIRSADGYGQVDDAGLLIPRKHKDSRSGSTLADDELHGPRRLVPKNEGECTVFLFICLNRALGITFSVQMRVRLRLIPPSRLFHRCYTWRYAVLSRQQRPGRNTVQDCPPDEQGRNHVSCAVPQTLETSPRYQKEQGTAGEKPEPRT